MSKFFVKNEQISNNEITIIGTDVNHIINVLRMKIGDEINICNSDLKENYIAEIVEVNQENTSTIKCFIREKLEKSSESNVNIHIFQGIPKADKMELIIEKNVEVGVSEITPVEMKRCIAKIKDLKKIERWQKIAEVAAKQSRRDIIPRINLPINIKNICNLVKDYDIVLLAYEEEKNITLKQELIKVKEQNKDINIGIIIGPEGGMEKEEVEELQKAGAKIITLGSRILRTETARTGNECKYNI